jgi:hypothetical protein
MSALIGALRVSLSAETAQFEAGMRRAQRTANQTNSAFKKSFGGLGNIVKAGFAGVVTGLSIGLITQGVKAALDYAGSLGEISQQLGVTTKDLQVFRYAAGQAGISQEEMEQGLGRLTKAMGQAQAGSKTMIAAFNAIGISVDDIRDKDAGEVFRLMADGLAKIPNAADRAAVEVAIFGRAGQKLDTLLAGGSAAINELAQAAEQLGIVLSDEQIQKADQTADKLEAVKTVLSARIAGVVADNADAIFQLADALANVAAVAVQAAANFGNFINIASRNIEFLMNPIAFIAKGRLQGSGNVTGLNKAGSSVTVDLPPAKPPKAAASGGGIKPFLASGGGGGRSRGGGSNDAERKRQEALRNAFQFDQEILRAQMDTLRAQQSLATDYSERAALSIQMLNLEQQGFQREMEYAVASGDLSKAQAAQLEAEFAKKDALERQAVLAEEEAQRYEDYNALEQVDFDLQRDILDSQLQIADTAKEQRSIRLRLLDLDYRAEQARLETILADEQASYAAKEEARRRLANLKNTYGNDRQGVIRDTAGPFEQAQIQFGDLSEEMESLKVQGIMGAADALTALTGGFEDFKDAAISAIKQVIAEFIRLQMIKFLMNIAGGIGGMGGGGMGASSAIGYAGLPGFATGGGFNILGNGGVDRNILSLNGLPIARVSHGERVSIGTDATRGGSPVNISQTFNGPVSRETMMQAARKTGQAVAAANKRGF